LHLNFLRELASLPLQAPGTAYSLDFIASHRMSQNILKGRDQIIPALRFV